MFECQGWGGRGVYKKWEKKFTDSKLNVEHKISCVDIMKYKSLYLSGAGAVAKITNYVCVHHYINQFLSDHLQINK